MSGRVACVDLGATWLRVHLSDGKRRRFLRRRAVNWRRVARALRALRLGPLDELVIGPTGVQLLRDRRALARSLRGLARRVDVLNDIELAHRLHFDRGAGVVVNGGTGSIAFGRNAAGKTARAGGLGPYLGDEGSGFWIGKRAVNEPRLARRFSKGFAVRLAHEPNVIRSTAALAPRVMKWAAQGEPAAKAIRKEAAEHLARLAIDCATKLGLKGACVAMHGSVLKDERLAREFKASLRRRGLSTV